MNRKVRFSRPKPGSPKGKTVWRKRITRKGEEVSRILQRRLVAVLGTADDFSPRMVLEAKRPGLLLAPKVIWLSDGGRWLWKLFSEHFEQHVMGVLGFYHAAQNLWKGITACLDGRTRKARAWFRVLRHRLRHEAMIIVLASGCHRKIITVSNYLNFLPFLKLMGIKKA